MPNFLVVVLLLFIKILKMKKLFIIAVIATSLFASCNKKVKATELKTNVVMKDTLSDLDRYEGKIVMGSNNQWYLIKDGLRWRTNSVEATSDYLKTIPENIDNVVNNVPIQTLQQFPEVGEIYPKLVFKKDGEKDNK